MELEIAGLCRIASGEEARAQKAHSPTQDIDTKFPREQIAVQLVETMPFGPGFSPMSYGLVLVLPRTQCPYLGANTEGKVRQHPQLGGAFCMKRYE